MGQRILIVDGDQRFAAQLRELLDFQGHEANLVATGPEAVEAWKSAPADVLLLEVLPAGLSATRLLEAIRALPGGADAPVLVRSGIPSAERALEPESKRLGIWGFVAQVANPLDVGRAIEEVLANEEGGRVEIRALRGLAGPSAAPPAPTPLPVRPPVPGRPRL